MAGNKKSEVLAKALESAQAQRPLAEIAKAAKVSTRALAKAKAGWSPSTELRTRRQKVGVAETVTRLAVYLGIRPDEALRELGIMGDDAVAAAISRAARDAARPQIHPDRALSDIAIRASTDPQGSPVVKAGILAWEPFHRAGEESSFGRQYLEALLRSVNPNWRIEYHDLETIDEAINALVSPPVKCDLIFGLYDLPYRRQEGLDFVPIPGISVSLGAIVSEQLSSFDWPSLLYQTANTPLAMVMKEEAGYHILVGSSGYANNNLLIQDHHSLHDLASDLLKQWSYFEASRGRSVCLVADAFSCRGVLEEISHLLTHSPPNLDQPAPRFRLLERDTAWTPAFELGVALRADSTRFKSLLNFATRQSLFHHGLLRTAGLYLDLFEQTDSSDLIFQPSHLEAMGEFSLKQFRDASILVHGRRREVDSESAMSQVNIMMPGLANS